MLSSLVTKGQQVLDSLQAILENSGIHDSTRVHAYNELAFYFAANDPTLGLAYADSALLLSRRRGFLSLEATSYNNLGVNYWYQGKDSLALVTYQKALRIFQSLKNRRREAIAYNNLALISYNREDYSSALDYHRQAQTIFQELGLTKNLVTSLSNIGVVLLALSDYPKALESFLEAYSQTNEEDGLIRGNLMTNLGLVSKHMNQLEKAIEYHHAALRFFQINQKKQEEANALANLGNVYQEMAENQKADSLLNLALAINLELGNERRIASDYTNLGILYKSSGELVKAEVALLEAQTRYELLGDRVNLSLVKLELSGLELVKNVAKPNWNRTLALQLESLELADEGKSISRKQAALEAISKSYHMLGDSENALEAYRKSVELRDSIFNDENERKLLRLQIEYDVKAKNASLLAANELEKEKLKSEKAVESFYARLYMLLLIFVMVILVLGYFFLRKRAQARQAVYQGKIAELQLKSLRAQMDPHFIFNALNSISNFLLKNEAEMADFYLGKFANLIRLILESSEQRLISFSVEMELLDAYVSIESMRLGKDIHLHWDLAEPIDAGELLIPPMLLQPLVENSIWHGISTTDLPGEILIKVRIVGESLHLSVIDNGQGDSADKNGKSKNADHQSMAMKIVQERIELLAATQSKTHLNSISWKSLNTGFQVEIVIPYFSNL